MNNDNSIELDIELIEGDNDSMELGFAKSITSKETSSSMSILSFNVERKSLNYSSKSKKWSFYTKNTFQNWFLIYIACY